MKTYVRRFGLDPESNVPERETHDEREARRTVRVDYCPEPEWKIPTREMAAIELQTLQRMWVYVEGHYCEFSIDELPDGAFAIVCLSHPA
jgi:hypothetical protein